MISKIKFEKRSVILKCKYRWYTNVTKQQMEKPKRQNGKVKPITSWKACLNTWLTDNAQKLKF